MTYNYYIGFLAFVQIAVALNFGFLILDKKSILVQFQQGIFNWIKGMFKDDIEYAQSTYKRVRDTTMPKEFVDKKDELQGLLSVFAPNMEYKSLSLFMPGLGFVTGLYSLLFLLIVPLWADGEPTISIDMFEIITQATAFSICMMPLTLYYKSTFSSPYTGIICAIVWMAVYLTIALLLYAINCTWDILRIEWFFYLALTIPYIPIIVYVVRLVRRAWKRYKSIDVIASKSTALARDLDAYRDGKHRL